MADLTLPAPGGAGSLSDNANIVVEAASQVRVQTVRCCVVHCQRARFSLRALGAIENRFLGGASSCFGWQEACCWVGSGGEEARRRNRLKLARAAFPNEVAGVPLDNYYRHVKGTPMADIMAVNSLNRVHIVVEAAVLYTTPPSRSLSKHAHLPSNPLVKLTICTAAHHRTTDHRKLSSTT